MPNVIYGKMTQVGRPSGIRYAGNPWWDAMVEDMWDEDDLLPWTGEEITKKKKKARRKKK